MKLLKLLVFLVFSSAAIAGPQVKRNDDGRGNYARLFNKPCANDVILARTPPQYRAELFAGETFIEGKMYGMCWVPLPDGTVGMLYEDGDAGRLPMTAFRPEPDA